MPKVRLPKAKVPKPASKRPHPPRKTPPFKGRTIVAILLDASGSMLSCLDATIDGFNEYIGGLQRAGLTNHFVTLTRFNTDVFVDYHMKPLAEVPLLTSAAYSPDGMTAYWDAKGITIKAVDPYLREQDRVVFVTLTDGMENSSREYSEGSIERLQADRTVCGRWTFTLITSNEKARRAEIRMGTPAGNVAAYTASASGTRAAFRALRGQTVNYSRLDSTTSTSFHGARLVIPEDDQPPE